MTDQLPNNNQASPVAPVNPLMQGPPPSPSSSPATVLPDAPPPQDIAVDPVPLPSASPSNMVNPGIESAVSPDINVETVVEPDPVKMPEAVVEQPVPETMAVPPAEAQEKSPDTGAPVPEEDPSAIRPPQSPADKSTSSSQQHSKISKKIMAGIASLVFLISGLSVGIYFNSQNFGVFDSRRYAADNMCNVDGRICDNPGDWERGWFEARQEENINKRPVQDEYTSANPANDPNQGLTQEAQIIRQAGEDNEFNRSSIAAEDAAKKGGDPVNASTVTAPTLPPLLPSGSGVGTPSPLSGGTPGPSVTAGQSGDASQCYGIGGGQVERDCLANAKNGRYTSGVCIGKTVEECSKLGKPTYCSGTQEKAGTARAGEFLNCGGTSTNGCGQVDVYDSAGKLIGFVIDKSGCNGKPPETNTENAPPRDLQTPIVPGGATATQPPVTVSAKCDSLVGQTKDNSGAWVDRTDAAFVGLARPGDQVRFVCTGHKTQGNFTKAAFFINNILHDDVIKLSADKYAVLFTIPASGALEVEAVLLHDREGWVD